MLYNAAMIMLSAAIPFVALAAGFGPLYLLAKAVTPELTLKRALYGPEED